MYDSTRVRPPSASRRSRGSSTGSTDTAVAAGVPPRLAIPQEPPKVPRRPPSKGNKRETLADIARRIPVQLMRHYFNYPLRAAAEAMHISVTTLKRLCRRHGVKRWPHRQICGINRSLNDLEAQHETAKGEEVESVADQLRQLHRRREVIIELAFESEDESSCKDFEDAPPAAHKRKNGRGSFTSSDGDSSSPSSPSSSPSHSRSASFTSAPGSPNPLDGSPADGEAAAGEAWWKHHPGIDLPSAAAALAKTVSLGSNGGAGATDRSAAATSTSGSSGGGVKRPRQPSGVGSSSGRSKGPRKPKSSAMFGTIPPPRVATGAPATAAAVTATKHRRKNSSSSSVGSSSVGSSSTSFARSKKTVTKAVTPVRATISVPSRSLPSLDSAGSSSSCSNNNNSSSSSSSRKSSSADAPSSSKGTSVAPPPLMIPTPSLVSDSSCASSSSSSSCDDNNTLFGLDSPTGNQQIDDLSVLGDLLFGPDEAAAAAAAAGARAQSLLSAQIHPGVFSHSASSQWGSQGPCVPLCPEGVFSQDAFLISASPFSYDNGFSGGLASANNWGSALSWDSNGLGSSVGPL
ncbi:unnamed protein product [Scytosiphon promiscuus]